MRKGVLLPLSAAFILSVGAIIYLLISQPAIIENGQILEPSRKLEDFQLIDFNEKKVTKDLFKGKWSVLTFGFTSCPDICPTTLAFFKNEMSLINENREFIQFIFVSIDPERDSPEKIKSWVQYFDPSIIGLTGTTAELKKFTRMFGAWFQTTKVDGSEEYTVNHPPYFYLVNPEGEWKAFYNPPLTYGRVAQDLNRLIPGEEIKL